MDSLFNINIFDAVVLGLIVLLSIKGLLSGFLKEFFNSIALIGALAVASLYKSEVAQYTKEYLNLNLSAQLLELISLIVVFLLVFLLVKAIYKIINSFLDEDISTPSRLLGMIIKMATLFFVFSLIVYGLSSKPQVAEKFKDTLDKSKLYPILKNTGATILNMPTIDSATTTDTNSTSTESKSKNITEANSSISPEQKPVEKPQVPVKVEENNSIESNNSTVKNSSK